MEKSLGQRILLSIQVLPANAINLQHSRKVSKMTDEQFKFLINEIRVIQTINDKLRKKVNVFIEVIYLLIFFSIVAAGCSMVGLI